MRNRIIPILATVLFIMAMGSTALFAQSPAPAIQERIAQQVVIANQRVDAALVLTAAGGIQNYSCPTPQRYVTPDGATSGWACFDPTTGVWLLGALPLQQPQAPAPARVIVRQAVAPPVVYSYPVVAPAVIYAAPVYPRVVVQRVYYPPSVAIGVAAINAGGRIAAAIIESSHHDHRDIRIVQSGRRR